MTIQLSYFDKSGQKQTINSTIGIKIGGTTDFDVNVQQYSSGTISFSIANIGVNPATSVAVSIPAQSDYTVGGATSVFLGNLNSGDFGVASFELSSRVARTTTSRTSATSVPFSNSTAVSNTITLQISYSDTSGVRQIVQKQVVLDLTAMQGTSSTAQRNRGFGFTNIIILIVAIIAIAVGLVWYIKFRKKKSILQAVKNIFKKKS